MSSLAFNAAPFNNQQTQEKKKIYNKTIKKRRNVHKLKQAVQNLNHLSSIDESNSLSNFEPMTAPKLTKKNDDMKLIMNENNIKPKNYQDVNEQYQKHNENNMTTNYYSKQESNRYVTNEMLLKKINEMISMLEEQKDQRTDYVSEELVLYSFLGVFIIFVVDSFARVGKYIR